MDIADTQGQTALVVAIRGTHPEIAKLLLVEDVLFDVADLWGQTPVMHAILEQQHQIVHDIVRKGANLNHVDSGG